MKHFINQITKPLACAALCLSAVGCHWDMWDNSRIKPLEPAAFFESNQSARPLPEGVVPYRQARPGARPYQYARLDSHFDEGTINGEYAEQLPFDQVAQIIMGLSDDEFSTVSAVEARRAVLERGKEAYSITCFHCHGAIGDGQGMIVKRGFPRPPSYHIDRLRQVEDGYIFDVMTNGFGRMYSYAARVQPVDRWAIVAYIRALQLSQNVSFAELTEEEQERILHPERFQEEDDHGAGHGEH